MQQKTLILVLMALWSSCSLPLSAQNAPGEPPRADNMLWAAACTKGGSAWVPAQPLSDNTAGLLMLGQNQPAQNLTLFAGWLGAFMKEGTVYTLGFEVFPVYENSPGSAWSEFGSRWHAPTRLDPAIDDPTEAPQYLHIDPVFMWEGLGGNPANPANWAALGQPSPAPGSGINGVGYVSIFDPGPIWDWALQKAQSRIPPKGPPGAGGLVGVNLVMQLGVVNGNGANGIPVVNLSNALALTITPGPPLKVNMTGGNHGNDGDGIHFHGTNIAPGMIVQFPKIGGGLVKAPIHLTSGSQFSARVPALAKSGLLSFVHPHVAQPVTTTGTRLFVRRHAPVQNFIQSQSLSWTAAAIGNQPYAGLCFSGMASTSGTLIALPPLPTASLHDLTLQIYTYDPLTDRAGLLHSGLGISNLLSASVGLTSGSLSPISTSPGSGLLQALQALYPMTTGGYSMQINAMNGTGIPFFVTAQHGP